MECRIWCCCWLLPVVATPGRWAHSGEGESSCRFLKIFCFLVPNLGIPVWLGQPEPQLQRQLGNQHLTFSASILKGHVPHHNLWGGKFPKQREEFQMLQDKGMTSTGMTDPFPVHGRTGLQNLSKVVQQDVIIGAPESRMPEPPAPFFLEPWPIYVSW